MPRRKPETADQQSQAQDPNSINNETMTQAPAAATTEAKNIIAVGNKLVGKELLDHAAKYAGQPIDQVAKECGYYKEITNRETGESRTNILGQDFMAAMFKAQSGIEFAPPTRAYSRRSNRPPVVKVGGNGNIVIGNRYSSIAGFNPASKVQIEAIEGKITITAGTSADDEGAEPQGAEPEIDQDDLDI